MNISSEENISLAKFSYCKINDDYIYSKPSLKKVGYYEEMDWHRRQCQYILFYQTYRTSYDLKKGEIYIIDWGINVNGEISGLTYGIVLKDSSRYNSQVIICPIKSYNGSAKIRGNNIDLGIVEGLNKLHHHHAVITQIRTIDKIRVTPIVDDEIDSIKIQIPYSSNNNETKIPQLNDEKMNLILKAYMTFLVVC